MKWSSGFPTQNDEESTMSTWPYITRMSYFMALQNISHIFWINQWVELFTQLVFQSHYNSTQLIQKKNHWIFIFHNFDVTNNLYLWCHVSNMCDIIQVATWTTYKFWKWKHQCGCLEDWMLVLIFKLHEYNDQHLQVMHLPFALYLPYG